MEAETIARGPSLTESEWAFTRRAMRRQRLFLALSAAGLIVAVSLSVYYGWRRWHDPHFAIGARIALVLLILLNARQNLRQYRYAAVLCKLAVPLGPDPSGRGA